MIDCKFLWGISILWNVHRKIDALVITPIFTLILHLTLITASTYTHFLIKKLTLK